MKPNKNISYCIQYIIGFIFLYVTLEETIDFIEKFRWIDKHHTFHRLMPCVFHTPNDQRDFLSEILRKCCTDLLALYRNKRKPVSKIQARKIVSYCMDEIAHSPLTADNKDFGYELCWYLADKLCINLKKSSYGKIWGYWRIIDKKVITVNAIRKAKG